MDLNSFIADYQEFREALLCERFYTEDQTISLYNIYCTQRHNGTPQKPVDESQDVRPWIRFEATSKPKKVPTSIRSAVL